MVTVSMWKKKTVKEEKRIKAFKRVMQAFTPRRWYQEVIITSRQEGGESMERM